MNKTAVRVLKLSSLLAVNIAGIALMSCGRGGGANGNGTTQTGAYYLSANIVTSSPIYSVTSSSGQITIPQDNFTFNVSFFNLF